MDGGAAFIGFMQFAASPRHISLESAAALARPARSRTAIVSVSVDPDDALLDRIVAILAPDYLQLHGAETPARVAQIAARTGRPVIKVLGVSSAADLDAAKAYEGAAHLMFEPKPPPHSDRPGGHGRAMAFEMMAGRSFPRPWFLAGGLTPWNVAEAVTVSGAPMVDVSSGVERGAGLKDPALIRAFLSAVETL